MKKNLLLLLIMSLAFAAGAQKYFNPNSPYHRTGDTIDRTCPIYHIQWWPDTVVRDSHCVEPCRCVEYVGDNVLQYNYTRDSLRVVGLAAWITYVPHSDELVDEQEYLQLWEASGNSFDLKASVPITGLSNLQPHRTMYVPTNKAYQTSSTLDCVYDNIALDMYPFVEYYFDSAITVYDSFYVGTTWNSSIFQPYAGDEFYWFSMEAGLIPASLAVQLDWHCPLPNNPHWKIYSPIFDDQFPYVSRCSWSWVHTQYFMMVFPIIEEAKMDTTPPTCPIVMGQHVEQQMLDFAVFSWSGHEYFGSYEVAFGPSGTDPDSCQRFTTNDTSILLYMEEGVNYVVYVRGVCVFDTVGLWSSPRYMHIGMDITQDTVDLIRDVEQMSLVLSPNPTTGLVRASSTALIRHMAVYDMAGKRVFESDYPNPKEDCVADLSMLSPGTYVVVVRTDRGVATERLSVQ